MHLNAAPLASYPTLSLLLLSKISPTNRGNIFFCFSTSALFHNYLVCWKLSKIDLKMLQHLQEPRRFFSPLCLIQYDGAKFDIP